MKAEDSKREVDGPKDDAAPGRYEISGSFPLGGERSSEILEKEQFRGHIMGKFEVVQEGANHRAKRMCLHVLEEPQLAAGSPSKMFSSKGSR